MQTQYVNTYKFVSVNPYDNETGEIPIVYPEGDDRWILKDTTINNRNDGFVIFWTWYKMGS